VLQGDAGSGGLGCTGSEGGYDALVGLGWLGCIKLGWLDEAGLVWGRGGRGTDVFRSGEVERDGGGFQRARSGGVGRDGVGKSWESRNPAGGICESWWPRKFF
jgi:hypothetical protein